MYKMKIYFSDGTVEECDEDYASEAEAEADFSLLDIPVRRSRKSGAN